MRQNYLAVVAFLMTAIAFSQGTITGNVVDDLGSPLPGANVVVQGTTNGVSADFDGNFTIEVAEETGTLVISYIGFITKNVGFTATGDIGSISLLPNAEELEGVVVTGIMDIAKDRETPVAASTITASVIQEKLGAQEFPEILRSTPSVYATKSGGGFGDGRVNVRGFDSPNIAIMINGIPVNDMENGRVFWSNWAGLSDVTTAMQVQRGLGSSKLAISSVGGTINIITKSTELSEGGALTVSAGNDGYLKTNVSYNTGRMDNGFAASVLLGRTSGDGYINGTEFEGYNYFIGLGYEPNEKHSFQFLITGAPQVHNQRTTSFFNMARLSDYIEHGAKYNFNDGTLNGEEFGWRKNFYHKPITSLNWDWSINEKSTLSTSVYASFGRGGGTGDIGVGPSFGFASSSRYRNPANGQVDYDLLTRFNSGDAVTFYDGRDYQLTTNDSGEFITTSFGDGLVRRASINSHNWLGAISNLHTEVNENFSYDLGVDLRSYKGIHYRRVDNLLGADGYFDDDDINNPDHTVRANGIVESDFSSIVNVFKSIDKDEKIDYHNDGLVRWLGAFGQAEYKNEVISAFVQGGISQQGFKRIDYFNYLDSDPAQETDWENIIGGNFKGGLNINFDEANNIFVNGGYYLKQPNFDAIYLNFRNDLNPNHRNEKILGLEAGYGLNLNNFRIKLNVYRTSWKDRFIRVGLETENGDEGFANISGVEQIHKGVEIETNYRASDFVQFKGMISLGDWEYAGDVSGVAFDDERNVLGDVTLFLDGVKVGDAAQFTSNIEMIVRPVENLKLSASWFTAAKLYAAISAEDFDTPGHQGSLRLPTYNLFDVGAYYKFKLGGSNAIALAVNVNNLFNTEYISESRTNIHGGSSGPDSYNGINTRNKAFFGFGRTWNVNLRYNF